MATPEMYMAWAAEIDQKKIQQQQREPPRRVRRRRSTGSSFLGGSWYGSSGDWSLGTSSCFMPCIPSVIAMDGKQAGNELEVLLNNNDSIRPPRMITFKTTRHEWQELEAEKQRLAEHRRAVKEKLREGRKRRLEKKGGLPKELKKIPSSLFKDDGPEEDLHEHDLEDGDPDTSSMLQANKELQELSSFFAEAALTTAKNNKSEKEASAKEPNLQFSTKRRHSTTPKRSSAKEKPQNSTKTPKTKKYKRSRAPAMVSSFAQMDMREAADSWNRLVLRTSTGTNDINRQPSGQQDQSSPEIGLKHNSILHLNNNWEPPTPPFARNNRKPNMNAAKRVSMPKHQQNSSALKPLTESPKVKSNRKAISTRRKKPRRASLPYNTTMNSNRKQDKGIAYPSTERASMPDLEPNLHQSSKNMTSQESNRSIVVESKPALARIFPGHSHSSLFTSSEAMASGNANGNANTPSDVKDNNKATDNERTLSNFGVLDSSILKSKSTSSNTNPSHLQQQQQQQLVNIMNHKFPELEQAMATYNEQQPQHHQLVQEQQLDKKDASNKGPLQQRWRKTFLGTRRFSRRFSS